MLVIDSFCECGSIVCGSPWLAQRKVCACAPAAASAAASATGRNRFMGRLWRGLRRRARSVGPAPRRREGALAGGLAELVELDGLDFAGQRRQVGGERLDL